MTGTLAAIDVGTNSFHLVVARLLGPDRFEVIGSEKEMVRLGHGGGEMKVLDPDAIERAVSVLHRFRRIADIHGATIRAVATSATREAENHDEFIARARTEAGVDVEVISGVEEARLIHLGVLQALPVFDRRLLLCDIGGGSTELLIGEQGEVLASRSFKLGAVRLTDRFFPEERARGSAIDACRKYVRSAISPFVREVDTHGFDVAIGSSGTIEAVCRIANAARGGSDPHSFNGFELSAGELSAVCDQLAAARTVAARRKIPGLEAKRADIILAGALILEQVVRSLGVSALSYSSYALREGVVLDTMQRLRGGSIHHLRDISRRSVRLLADLCDEEPEHSQQVARLACRLFDGTADLHRLDASAREYLEAGALLANVGLFVSHNRHHLHGYYVIRNSDRLAGFTDDEVEIIALLARYHRKSSPKPSHEPFARLQPDDQRVVRVLAGLLRVAIGLDRSHEHLVEDVRCSLGKGRVVIDVVPAGHRPIDLEMYAASERKALLEDALGVTVDLQVAEPSLPTPP
jgi:exopolyphosphatase / guanosine-5'-triphosphate,3'-diphosphate pyrophosphatase